MIIIDVTTPSSEAVIGPPRLTLFSRFPSNESACSLDIPLLQVVTNTMDHQIDIEFQLLHTDLAHFGNWTPGLTTKQLGEKVINLKLI